MRKIWTWILVIVSLNFAFGQNGDIAKTEWLLGTWELKSKKGIIYETWVKESNTRLSAKSYLIKSGDTVVLETVELVQKEEGLFYIPTVSNQNEGRAIKFKLKSLTDSTFMFENLMHDSPNVICYQKKGSDSILAEIWTYKEDDVAKGRFSMTRSQ